MKKTRTKYTCQSCGYEAPGWMGKCPECDAWNTFVEESVIPSKNRGTAKTVSSAKPQPISGISGENRQRLKTGIKEFDRVLGGGIVAGSVNLIGGAPGIGKSTLLLQIGAALAGTGKTVLYVSGEESVQQIKLRADRLKVQSEHFLLAAETHVESIESMLNDMKPDLTIVDSIQTVYASELESLPGNVSQVRFSGHRLTQAAKALHTPMFLIGHVTKDGHLAGPRVLEHMVDCLLLLEGDDQHFYRLLRSAKNRFGSTNEVGIFEMTDHGVMEVRNPSAHLLSQRHEGTPGTVVTVNLEGSRPLMVEVQALVSPTSYGIPQRTSTGIDHRRLSILLAVLEKRLGLRFGNQDVFVNAAGGIRLNEPGVDLAVAIALVSSLKDQPVHGQTAVIGEVGLTGEVRGISQIEKRIAEVERLGFDRLILPDVSLKSFRKKAVIKLDGAATLKKAVDLCFKDDK